MVTRSKSVGMVRWVVEVQVAILGVESSVCIRASVVGFAILGCVGCNAESDVARRLRETLPAFRYTAYTACGNAIILAFSEGDERLVVRFDRPALLPEFGQTKIIYLPDSTVDVHVVLATGDSRPDCGDVISGDPGFAVKWIPVEGQLWLNSAPVLREWITAGIEYFVFAELRDVKWKSPSGQIIAGPKQILLSGRAGLGPGG